MQNSLVYKHIFIIFLYFLLITRLVYAGDNQADRTIISHIQVGMSYGITPFNTDHNMPMHYQFDIGYGFQNKSAILIAINFYQLWNEGEEGTNYRILPGKYNEVNVAIIYRAYLDKILPMKYMDKISIGSGIGLNDDSNHSLSLYFAPSYDIRLSRSIIFPVGVTFIYNLNSVNENVYSNNYWSIFLGIRYN